MPLRNRRFWQRKHPFPHFVAHDVFEPTFFSALEAEFRRLLEQGVFARNMPNSDAYSWNFPATIDGPLAYFYSRAWHDTIALLSGVRATLDVNGALHHHQVGSLNGSVHNDVGIGYFSDQPRADGVNPMDLSRCDYTSGRMLREEERRTEPRRTVRAVTMLLYLCNDEDMRGGETGLYVHRDDPVSQPAAMVAPRNNTMLIFETTPHSWHSFIHNPSQPRNSVILWLHRSYEEAVEKFGEEAIYRWATKY